MSFVYFCILHPDLSTTEHNLQSFADGKLLLINKPYKWTSFDVVGKLRNAFKPLKLKVGHAGTLDPLATGLLIVCTGKMTKQIDTFQAEEKEYTGTLILGATTPSYDMETEVFESFDTSHITEDDIYKATKQFLGEIQQYPPAHSAIKVGGERLYEKARRGEEVELKSRTVTISEFEITAINLPEISFRVVCSKGTYIRSLIYDFGKALNNGAYLSKLRRTRSGNFKVEDAHEIMELVGEIREMKNSVAEAPHPNPLGPSAEGLQPPETVDEYRQTVKEKPHPNPPREGGLYHPGEVREYRKTADLAGYNSLKDFSCANRTNATQAEETLWQLLRKDSTGFRVRRQHVIDNYIADFICLQKGLIIEVDGDYHLANKEADELRTEILSNLGFEVLRVSNDEVLTSPQEVFMQIKNRLENMPDRQTPSLLGKVGEGLSKNGGPAL